MPSGTRERLTKRRVEQCPPGKFAWDLDVPGFGVRAYPSGRRTFVYQYRSLDGAQGRVPLGTYPTLTVEQARDLAREQALLVRKGENPQSRQAAEAPCS
jgi:hypothetical protein